MSDDKKDILLAEDDPGIIEVVQIVLKDAGYIAHIASSHKDIEKILSTNPVDLIFLDILLSGENGSDIAKALKENTQTKHIPVLLLSANMSIEEISKNSGADGFLRKPFDLDDFLKVIKQYTK